MSRFNCLPDVSSLSVFVVLLVGLQYVIVVFPDHAHLFFFFIENYKQNWGTSKCLSYRTSLCAKFYHMTLRLGT